MMGALRVGLLAIVLAFVCAEARASSSGWYYVLFEADTTDMLPRHMREIEIAVDFGRRTGWSCARVLGFSGRTGAPERRFVISRLRAEAVAQELVGRGVRAECVIIETCGDRHLLVPTEEGVAEVLNRRVEIIPFASENGPARGTLRPGPQCPWSMLPGIPPLPGVAQVE